MTCREASERRGVTGPRAADAELAGGRVRPSVRLSVRRCLPLSAERSKRAAGAMFRRARLNVRPNVRPAGRGAGGAADPEGSGSPVAATAEAAAGAAAEAPPAARRAER